MPKVNNKSSVFALVLGHMAGMMDIAALPIWVGIMIAGYGFLPAQAGGLATLFLGGVVVSSVLLAPVFNKMPSRWLPTLGFGISTISFYYMTQISSFEGFAAGHLIAGLATGLAISVIHGTMVRTVNPHRVFAMGGLTLGIFAVIYLGVVPVMIEKYGPAVLFYVFAIVMGIATVVTAIFFPQLAKSEEVAAKAAKFSKATWFAIGGIMLMALNQAMVFSFIERIGSDRGYDAGLVQGMLITGGVLAIVASISAVFFEKRMPPVGVAIVGATFQAIMAMAICWSGDFGYMPFVLGGALFPFIIIFTHTFVFGLLANIEPTGRANAATPAMIMTGSALGPLLGGVLTQFYGYEAIGVAAVLFALIGAILFSKSGKAVNVN